LFAKTPSALAYLISALIKLGCIIAINFTFDIPKNIVKIHLMLKQYLSLIWWWQSPKAGGIFAA
jgi:hypothetical protein